MMTQRSSGAGAFQGTLLVLIGCMPILGTLLVAPILPSMARHFATVPNVEFLVPFVQTAPAFVLAFTGVLAGSLANKMGRKRILFWSMVVYVLVAPAPLFIESLYGIIASRLVVGLAEAGLMTASTMLIGDYFVGSRRQKYLAMQVLASSVSAVVFITIGGLLGTLGWRTPFLVYLVPAILLPFVIFALHEPKERTDEDSTPTTTANFPWRPLSVVVFITFLAGMCMNLMSVKIGFIVDGLGEQRTSVIGIVAAINSAGIVCGSLYFASRWSTPGSIRSLAIALLIAASGYMLISSAGTTELIAIAGFLAGLGAGIYLPWLLAEANRLLGYQHRGRGIGLWMSTFYLAVVAGPPLATLIAGPAGGSQGAMIFFAVLLVLLAVIASLTIGKNTSQMADLENN